MKVFSIAALMGGVCVAAVGLAAVSSPSAFWASALYSLSLVVLGVGTLAAALGRWPDRAFWIGFALFGWGYMYFAFGEPIDRWQAVGTRGWSSNASPTPRPALVTTRLLEYLHSRATMRLLPAVGSRVQVQWGSPGSYYPATVTQVGDSQVQILWQGYQPGQEEWAAMTRVQSLEAENVLPAGHSLFALILATFGGFVARGIWSRSGGTGVIGAAREDSQTRSNATV